MNGFAELQGKTTLYIQGAMNALFVCVYLHQVYTLVAVHVQLSIIVCDFAADFLISTCVCVHACVCACVHACACVCACVCVRVCTSLSLTNREQWSTEVLHQEAGRPHLPPSIPHLVSQ